jgi:hypothetical protein
MDSPTRSGAKPGSSFGATRGVPRFAVLYAIALTFSLTTIPRIPGATAANKWPLPAPRASMPPATMKPRIAPMFENLPLIFEANHGQTAKQVKFFGRADGYALFLTGEGATLALRTVAPTEKNTLSIEDGSEKTAREAVLRMQLIGANLHARIEGVDKLPGKAIISPATIRRSGTRTFRCTRESAIATSIRELIWCFTRTPVRFAMERPRKPRAGSNTTSFSVRERIPRRSDCASRGPRNLRSIIVVM